MKRKFSKILGVSLAIALLTSLMVVATPVSALSAVSVTPTSTTISATTSYSILFTLGNSLIETHKIVVAFPTGTDLTSVGAGDISFAGTSGIGSVAFSGGSAVTIVRSLVSLGAENTVGPTLTISGLTIPTDNPVTDNVSGVGAMIQLVVADVKNPATAGTTYTLTVGTLTSADAVREAAVTSAAYEIKVPTVTALPGIASVYNSAGTLMANYTGSTAIATAIADTAASTATAGYTIKLSPGTYTEAPDTLAAGVTFVATGTAAETIIKGVFTIDVDKTTLDSLTITGGVVVSTAATSATIRNSIFKPGATTPATLLAIAADSNLASTNTSFAVTGTIATAGITIASGANVTVTDGIFTVDTLGTAIVATGKLTVTNGTFTGSSGTGTGFEMSGAGTVTVTGATFNTLLTALKTTGDGGTLTATKNTISGSVGDAISLAGNVTKVVITGNDIKGTAATKYAVTLATEVVAATKAFVVFNNITGNTLNIKNADTSSDKLDATHNWWGVATGPTTASISGDVNKANYLTSAMTLGTGAVSTASLTLVGKTTAGVDVTATGTSTAIIAASKYTDNPVSVAPPYSALSGGYFDVYVGTPTAITAVEIKLYGTVTADTKAYAWNTLQGTWVLAPSQGANTFSGFVFTTLTTATAPAIADLSGLPFVLVSGPAAAPAAPTLQAPAAAATDVSINTGFSWTSVTGATYNFDLATNSAFTTPVVSVTGLTSNVYGLAAPLINSTTYYWRVQSVTSAGTSVWATGIFVTEAAPAVVALAPPSLTAPAAGATTVAITNVPFTWTSVTGATSYTLVISANANLSSPVVTATAAGTAYTYTGTLGYSTPYYWQVTALTGTTVVATSAVATFITVAAPVVVVTPPVVVAPPSLTTPAAGATTAITNVPFTWTSVTGATSYTLVLSAKADLSTPVVTATAAGTAYTYAGTLGYSTPYYWQVTALTGTTVIGTSAVATFITVAAPVVVVPLPVVVAPVSIVSPLVGAIDVSIEPILTWTPYAGAIGYEVMVGTDKTFAIIDYSVNVAVATTFYKSEPLLYGETYYWRVRGVTGTAATVKAVAPGSAWANGIFTTEAAPAAPAVAEPTVIVQKEEAPPAQIIEVPVTTVVPQQIPSYLLWVIIVVGAVLIIALIVLIARTRRVT